MMYFSEENKCKSFIFENTNDIIVGVSTRKGGYSNGSYESLNLGINTNDEKALVLQNREVFFSSFPPEMQIIHLNQTHSNIVHNCDSELFKVFCDGDGLISQQKNKLLCITIADCGSVLFHDKDFTVACAIHCGWKGTQSGIIESALIEISKITDLQNIHAYLGPMIRCSNYEVGREFLNYFDSEYFKEHNGKLYFDLNQLIISKLLKANLASVTDCGFDTFSEPELFFSHRRDSNSGRMCAFIGLK